MQLDKDCKKDIADKNDGVNCVMVTDAENGIGKNPFEAACVNFALMLLKKRESIPSQDFLSNQYRSNTNREKISYNKQ